MVNAVGAYQQTAQLQTAAATAKRQEQVADRRAPDTEIDDTRVTRAKDAAVNKSAEAAKSTEDRRQTAVNDQPTQAAGKDAAQRRGSLLDVVA